MSRQRFDELLDAWADKGLTSDEAREFESLLIANPSLRGEAEAHAAFLTMVRSSPAPVAPPQLLERALRRARQMDSRSRPLPAARVLAVPPPALERRRKTRWERLRLMYGTAAAVALLAAGGWFVFDYATTAPSREVALVHEPAGHGQAALALGERFRSEEMALEAERLPTEVATAAKPEVSGGSVTPAFGRSAGTATNFAVGAPLAAPAASFPISQSSADKSPASPPALVPAEILADTSVASAVTAPPQIPAGEYAFLSTQAISSRGRVAGGPEAAESRRGFYVEFPDEAALQDFAKLLRASVPLIGTVPPGGAAGQAPTAAARESATRRAREIDSASLMEEAAASNRKVTMTGDTNASGADAFYSSQTHVFYSESNFGFAQPAVFNLDAYTSEVFRDVNTTRVRVIMRPLPPAPTASAPE